MNQEIEKTNTEIVQFNPEADVKNAQRAAKALMTVIDATKPLVMQGKRYLYFEHWQTVAKFFNTTVGISKVEELDDGYIATAVVYNRDGIVIGGAEAACMRDELNWKNKPVFQLRSMAQTRAMAKALRSIYGFVAVLAGIEPTPAEEMDTAYEPKNPATGQLEASNGESTRKPTPKQSAFIKQLATSKNITQEELKVMASGKTPSELITSLLAFQRSDQEQQLI